MASLRGTVAVMPLQGDEGLRAPTEILIIVISKWSILLHLLRFCAIVARRRPFDFNFKELRK